MKKITTLLALASLGTVAGAYAEPVFTPALHSGYVSSNVNHMIVRDRYNNCVHTRYFDKTKDGMVECGEAMQVTPPPVVVTPVVTVAPEVRILNDEATALFRVDSAALTVKGKQELDDLLNHLANENATISNLLIQGYTDRTGSKSYNLKLSQRRADSVAHYLESSSILKIDPSIVKTQGMGEVDVADSSCKMSYDESGIARAAQLKRMLADPTYGTTVTTPDSNSSTATTATTTTTTTTTKVASTDRATLEAELRDLRAKYSELYRCLAPDRKVVFTVTHPSSTTMTAGSQQQVNSTQQAQMSDSSADVSDSYNDQQ